jgi:PAS domain S-box-containing protein
MKPGAVTVKILSVDDKAENRLLVESMLTPHGYTVVSATNGIDALEKLRKEPFDVIISDLLMPKMDGFQLLHECKKDPALNKIPFIIYTATYIGKKDIEFGLSLGAVRYIIKPVEPDEFLAMLKEVLNGISTGTLAEAIPEITGDTVYATEHIRVLTEKMEKKVRALEKSQKQYRLLADNVSDVIWLLDVATERFVYVSPSVFALRGYTPEEVMAQPVSASVTPEAYQLIAGNLPDRIARFEAGDDTMRVQRYDIDQPRKDGTVVATEVVTTFLVGPDRRVTRILGVTRDITERKRAEEAIRESRQILEGVLNSIPVRVFWKDKNLIYAGCNTAFTRDAGFEKPEDIIGKDDYAMGWRDQADLYRSDDQAVIASGTSKLLFEEPQTTPSGEIIYLLTSKIPLRDARGDIVGVLGTYLDITERKQAEEQIKLANRKLALMTDVTYQDIQNKVTALRGYVTLIKEACAVPDGGSLIDKEEQILADIHNLINKTKEYQRMGMDEAQWIPLEEVIRTQVASAIQKPDVSLEMDLNGLLVYADPLIERVMFNLAENAVTHGKTTSRLSVYCRETPKGLVITCEDNGVGISYDQKPHIFDRVIGGGGHFMMFFIREILELSGMSITETGEPGKGARFEITVPKGAYRFTGTGKK